MDDGYRRRGIVFRPVSILYFLVMLSWAIFTYSVMYIFFESAFVTALGLSTTTAMVILIASIIGSHINIPVREVTSRRPIITLKRISFFGVEWLMPELSTRERRTVIAVNVGGAVVPVIVSAYLLFFLLPMQDQYPLISYAKTLAALIVVILVMNRVARPVPGLGIATPTLLPPLTTAVVSLALHELIALSNPFIISYVSGILGTLIGADILNLDKIPELGAPMVSIGGAGTFDGIYITGIVSVFLVLATVAM
ncbi:MAG: DUF1614 domain-containing protein [Candidatus Bathyarchaeia archaeon]